MQHINITTHGFLVSLFPGLVEVCETWQCLSNDTCGGSKRTEWETEALLKPLDEKYLTKLTNPRWLKRPIKSRGQKGIWTVNIPTDDIDS